ncbi:ribosomal RNA small subunit methyltransferase G [Desulfolithobacter dissulfuricans]|uniref:Ribosomal RNA small subunit methyltransferase G n=1 Tax=Desulfolithobacter dissulfuricans TaxID=2795293 RepID=A0A915XKD6_9BACT|nr:16S rRNA (guanine(527)-N(7))-methyltransferase RsmG [Desulfolithobacter dissulfuricans]BCO08126.1 ribosomal RNA small subunit methyltransferase G [Desulfolithobacter dissulfuricans]
MEELFRLGLEKLGLDLPGERLADLVRYATSLDKWSRKINLVARNTSRQDLVEKHFLDSLTLLPLVGADDTPVHLLDVGSGAGFPGLVLAAADPGLQVTLVEPRRKRVIFLNHVIRELGLGNVRVLDRRLEECGFRQDQFTHVTSRAVAAPEAFLEMVAPLLGAGTRVILMQGGSGLARWQDLGLEARYRLLGVHDLRLPFSGDQRQLLVVENRAVEESAPAG